MSKNGRTRSGWIYTLKLCLVFMNVVMVTSFHKVFTRQGAVAMLVKHCLFHCITRTRTFNACLHSMLNTKLHVHQPKEHAPSDKGLAGINLFHHWQSPAAKSQSVQLLQQNPQQDVTISHTYIAVKFSIALIKKTLRVSHSLQLSLSTFLKICLKTLFFLFRKVQEDGLCMMVV